MRRFLVVVVVLALVLIAADYGLKVWAQDRLSRELHSSLALSEPPSVSLEGFPFLPRVAAGNLPSVSISARNVPAEPLSIRRVDLLLRDVQFSPVDLLLGDQRIRVRRGEGTARLTAADVTEALRDRGFPAKVRLASGKVFVSADSLPAGEIEARVSLDRGSLVITPIEGNLPVPLSVKLPRLIRGLRYTKLRVRRSTALLSFRLKNAKLVVRDGAVA